VSSSLAVAAVAAGAALAASALTGTFTMLAARRTAETESRNLIENLKAQTTALMTQLAAERKAAREDRDQERRRDAYPELLKYVYWVQRVNIKWFDLVANANNAVLNIRSEKGPRTTETAAAEDAAFFAALQPISDVEKGSYKGPTPREHAAMYALVRAVATDAVLDAYTEVNKANGSFENYIGRVRSALLTERVSLPKASDPLDETSDSDITEARKEMQESHDRAVALIEEAGDFATANFRLIDAYKNFFKAVEKLENLVRADLNNPPDSES
jgi:hypothetical protein